MLQGERGDPPLPGEMGGSQLAAPGRDGCSQLGRVPDPGRQERRRCSGRVAVARCSLRQEEDVEAEDVDDEEEDDEGVEAGVDDVVLGDEDESEDLLSDDLLSEVEVAAAAGFSALTLPARESLR
ncbi:hypothetical protein Ahu01nite_041980 [Winogradskya humida]|uniref:Uncharacterized protein n=1 Tax=Winogradskya humida TaxID=113566 RepID=A0ABQ3ZRA6_9ACTN|nr:hypothetical protein Ahu01nite_041980 [Actinoplanes humidus]